jgi:hypothetical protein
MAGSARVGSGRMISLLPFDLMGALLAGLMLGLALGFIAGIAAVNAAGA